jgi:hypothetical protein
MNTLRMAFKEWAVICKELAAIPLHVGASRSPLVCCVCSERNHQGGRDG